MKRIFLSVLVLVLIALLAACGSGESEPAAGESGELTVTDVKANMTMPSDTGSLWMQIHNGTAADDDVVFHTASNWFGLGRLDPPDGVRRRV